MSGVTARLPGGVSGFANRRWVRLVIGLVISAAFAAVTLSRVEISGVGDALGRVNPWLVLLAVPIVFAEFGLRAFRWQRLLAPLAAIPLRRAGAYLAIGYLANSMLPARLGDVARAHLAGRSFGVGRLGVLGTIIVERLADGAFILGVVALLGLTVAGGLSLAETATWLILLALAGLLTLGLLLVYLRGEGGGAIRTSVRSLVDRVLVGVAALRTPAIAASTVILTAAAFAVAAGMFAVVAEASGADLTLAQCALVMGGLALSTSIPAGPGTIGTYEFVGLTILTALGMDAETALAIVVLVHVVATLPLALTGLLAAWQLHFRLSEISETAES